MCSNKRAAIVKVDSVEVYMRAVSLWETRRPYMN